jgi:hypothetical protein
MTIWAILSFTASSELHQNFIILFLKFLSIYLFGLFINWLCLVKTACNKPANKIGLLYTKQVCENIHPLISHTKKYDLCCQMAKFSPSPSPVDTAAQWDILKGIPSPHCHKELPWCMYTHAHSSWWFLLEHFLQTEIISRILKIS